jgi:hypothetical protein
MKAYEVLEVTFPETNSYYYRDRDKAQERLDRIKFDNDIQGRVLVDDNRLLNYDIAANRRNYCAIMQETELSDDEAELLED